MCIYIYIYIYIYPPTLGTRVRACKDREVDVILFACLFLHRGSFSDVEFTPRDSSPWELGNHGWELGNRACELPDPDSCPISRPLCAAGVSRPLHSHLRFGGFGPNLRIPKSQLPPSQFPTPHALPSLGIRELEGKWEVGNGKCGKWEVGNGEWEMGSGK
jgi:hypothetical protein